MATLRDKGNVALHLDELRPIRRFSTTYHDVAVYRHPDLGLVLSLNKEIQHVEAWSPLYHEPLIHLPGAFIREPRTALVLGGGSFFAVRELLKYGSIERVLMIDIDRQLLDAVAELYEHAAIVQNDSRLEVRIANAFDRLDRQTERFDIVINDSVDLLQQGPGVFSDLARLLEPQGVCADVVYRHVFAQSSATRTLRMIKDTFSTALALVVVPEYPGVLHLLTLWSYSSVLTQARKTTVNGEQLQWIRRPSSNPCVYYDPRFMSYYLHLPKFVRDCFERR